MTVIPMSHGLILGGVLFALGLAGLLMRRNLLFILISLEIMLNGAGVAFVAAGSRWGQPDGQIMFLFILAAAAAEVAAGLAPAGAEDDCAAPQPARSRQPTAPSRTLLAGVPIMMISFAGRGSRP